MLSISLDLMTTPLWTVHSTYLLSIIPLQNLDNSFDEEIDEILDYTLIIQMINKSYVSRGFPLLIIKLIFNN